MRRNLTTNRIDQLPRTPGVYYFLNARREIVYVGKATSLRARVSSYWAKPENRQVTQFLAKVRSIKIRETPSALEAVILEANEIKRLQPRYNVMQKDDKRFAQIVVTNEAFPQILVRRPTDQRTLPVKQSFGPYLSAHSARVALKLLRRIFPYRCRRPIGSGRACLDYHLGLCPGTCLGVVSHEQYAATIDRLTEFLNGQRTVVVRALKRAMTEASRQHDFEQAATLRDQLFALEHIQDVALMTDDRESVIARFPIQRIEGYDISLSAGRDAVGSLVVLHYGIPVTSEYRRFVIRTVPGTNDSAMLCEVLTRRLRHAEWPIPDLFVVDGGLQQRNAVATVLRDAGHGRPAVVGIAKGPDRRRADLLPTPAARALIRRHGLTAKELDHVFRLARDEAHRFAVNFHRDRRSKRILNPS